MTPRLVVNEENECLFSSPRYKPNMLEMRVPLKFLRNKFKMIIEYLLRSLT